MDLDAYTAAHEAEWARLEQLSRARRLDGPDADELVERYQTSAAQLSDIRTTVGQSVQGDRLSLALSRARGRLTRTPADPLRQLTVFFAAQLPAALYRVRWATLAVTAAFLIVATATGVWFASDPLRIAALGAPEDLERYASEDFVGYYSASSESVFAAQVWTNNAFIAAQCIAFGIIGVWVPFVLVQNAVGIGSSGAIMAEYGRLDDFFLFILPHGQLELYAVFVAGATGLMIFWSWVAPGARSRSQALAEDGRALFTIVIGLILALLLSGLVEGFVTRQDWPWPIKIGIGTAALGVFLAYQWGLGRRAWRAGETGDLDAFEGGARRIVAG